MPLSKKEIKKVKEWAGAGWSASDISKAFDIDESDVSEYMAEHRLCSDWPMRLAKEFKREQKQPKKGRRSAWGR